MQLLQQTKVTGNPASAFFDSKRPDPSYIKDEWAKDARLNYTDALKVLVEDRAKEAIKQNNNAVALIELADVHYSKRSYKLAKRYYLKSLRLTKNSIHVLRRLTRLCVEKKEFEDAERFYKLLLEKSSNYSDIVNYLNFVLFYNENFNEDHLHVFAEYSAKYNDSPDIRNLYGVALLRLGSVNTAFTEFEALEHEFPSFVHAANNLGVSYLVRNNPKTASKYFLKAIKIDRSFVYAYQNIASAYLALKNDKDALAILAKARALDLPLEDKWLGNLAQLSGDNNTNQDEAISIHEKLIEKYPFNSLFLNNLGVNYNRQGKVSKALEFYERAVHNLDKLMLPVPHPKVHGVILNNLLELSIKTNHEKKASEAAKSILKLFPNNIPALSYRIRTLVDEHNLEEARELSERAYKIDKAQPDVVLNLSYIYSVADLDNERALSILEEFESHSADMQLNNFLRDLMYNNIAYNLIKLGRLSQAKDYLEKAAESPIVTSTNALYALYCDDPTLAQKLYDKAFATISDSFNRDMNILFSNYEFAKYYFDKGDNTKALEYTHKGLEYNINKKMHQRLGKLYSSINKRIANNK